MGSAGLEIWVHSEAILLDGASLDQVFLDDPFEDFRGAMVVPSSLRIDNGNGALCADTQTIDFASINKRMRPDQLQFLQTAFQILPGFQTFHSRTAFGFRLIGAKEDVAPVPLEPKSIRGLLQFTFVRLIHEQRISVFTARGQ